MKLIVGLGNPGSEYAQTRHNAGFMLVDRVLARTGLAGVKAKFHARTSEVFVGGQRCLLMQPMTYMNRSGLAVREAMQFFKLDPETDLLVVVDDVALPVGRIRIRKEGGTGGHNGLADIQQALSTPAYARLRVGIDPPGRVPQVQYVLGRFTVSQLEQLQPALDLACDAVECWVSEGIDQAMTRYNRADA